MTREELLLLVVALGDGCEDTETLLRKRRRMTRPKLAEELRELLLVLAGDYRDCDETTRESLSIGLRGIEHERCKAAIVKLWPKGVPAKHRRTFYVEQSGNS